MCFFLLMRLQFSSPLPQKHKTHKQQQNEKKKHKIKTKIQTNDIKLGLDVPTIHSRYGISAKARLATTVHCLFPFLLADALFDTESKR